MNNLIVLVRIMLQYGLVFLISIGIIYNDTSELFNRFVNWCIKIEKYRYIILLLTCFIWLISNGAILSEIIMFLGILTYETIDNYDEVNKLKKEIKA